MNRVIEVISKRKTQQLTHDLFEIGYDVPSDCEFFDAIQNRIIEAMTAYKTFCENQKIIIPTGE